MKIPIAIVGAEKGVPDCGVEFTDKNSFGVIVNDYNAVWVCDVSVVEVEMLVVIIVVVVDGGESSIVI